MPTLTAPDRLPAPLSGPLVFLAGSIEQGHAIPWQADVITRLLAERPDVVVANPRREVWDASWPQQLGHADFVGQVHWELDHLLASTQAFFVFDPGTLSPVTLLELGLLLGRHPARVTLVCPEGFWRQGNVVLTAARCGVAVFETVEEGLAQVLARLPAVV